MKKKELLLFAAPLLVMAAFMSVTAGTKYAGKVRASQEEIVVNAGNFNDEAGSRALLQKLSPALRAHPDNNTFVVQFQIKTKPSSRETMIAPLSLTYDRRGHILQQGGKWGFRYKGVTDTAVHDIAKQDQTVVSLSPNSYSRVHILTAKQRLAHQIEILPPGTFVEQ